MSNDEEQESGNQHQRVMEHIEARRERRGSLEEQINELAEQAVPYIKLVTFDPVPIALHGGKLILAYSDKVGFGIYTQKFGHKQNHMKVAQHYKLRGLILGGVDLHGDRQLAEDDKIHLFGFSSFYGGLPTPVIQRAQELMEQRAKDLSLDISFSHGTVYYDPEEIVIARGDEYTASTYVLNKWESAVKMSDELHRTLIM